MTVSQAFNLRSVCFRLSEQSIHIDKHPTSGNLLNTGQSLVFKVDTDRAANIPVNITGGPLSYRSVTLPRTRLLMEQM